MTTVAFVTLETMGGAQNVAEKSWKMKLGKHIVYHNTRNSFPKHAPGVTTLGDSAIKVTGGRTPRVLSGVVQLIELLPRAATWSNCLSNC